MQRHRPLNQRRAFAAWLATRPASVRAIARTIKPYRFYRIRRTGQVGQVIAFHDDGLLRVLVHEAPHGTPAEVLVPFCVEDVPWRAVDPMPRRWRPAAPRTVEAMLDGMPEGIREGLRLAAEHRGLTMTRAVLRSLVLEAQGIAERLEEEDARVAATAPDLADARATAEWVRAECDRRLAASGLPRTVETVADVMRDVWTAIVPHHLVVETEADPVAGTVQVRVRDQVAGVERVSSAVPLGGARLDDGLQVDVPALHDLHPAPGVSQ